MPGPCLVGLGHRAVLAPWIRRGPRQVECIEVTADHFFDDSGAERLHELREIAPLMVHGLGLSLGTPGPVHETALARFSDVVAAADPLWISEHVGFVRTGEAQLGHFSPVPPTPDNASIVAEHARLVSERCGKPIVLENITSHLQISGTLSETEFLGRVCDEADCGLLVDITNLFINSRNHGFDASAWLRDVDPARVVQLHAVGYSYSDGRYFDSHGAALQDELWDLLDEVLEYAPPQALILEWDRDFPPPAVLELELEKLGAAVARHQVQA